MKTRKLFFAGLAALAFAACNNEELVLDGNTPTGPSIEETGEPTWVNLKLSVASGAKSRATAVPGGTAESDGGSAAKDTVITDVTILVFNATSKVLENKEFIKFVDGKQQKKNFLATPGNKKIYAIANITDTLKEDGTGNAQVDQIWRKVEQMKVKNSTLEKYLELVYDLPAAGGLKNLIINGSHVMSSTDESPDFPILPQVASDNTTDNIVKLELNYMVAKVGLKLDTDQVATIPGIDGKLEGISYTLRNIAKKSFLTQKYPVKGVYYDSIPSSSTSTVTEWANYFWVPAKAAQDSLITANKFTYYLASENVNGSPVIGNTTYAAIKGTFVPTKAVDTAKWNELTKKVDLTYKALTAGSTFYVSAIANVPEIPAGTIFPSIELMKQAYGLQQSGGANSNPTGWVDTNYTQYTKGVCWYRLNIGEDKTGSTTTTYGIERGKIYNVTIKNITGLGFNSDGKLDGSETGGNTPDLPLTQETYINASVTVKGWETVTQDGNLN